MNCLAKSHGMRTRSTMSVRPHVLISSSFEKNNWLSGSQHGKISSDRQQEKRLLFRANSEVLCRFELPFDWLIRNEYSARSIFRIDHGCRVVGVNPAHVAQPRSPMVQLDFP